MWYHFNGRVRYSETDEKGVLTLPGILNYFQDCCTFHSEDIGQGMKVVESRSRVWMLSSWQVVIERYPAMGERLVISTAPYDFKGFMGMRNFTLDTESGERLAWANTYWTHINTKTGLPVKLTPEDYAGYECAPKLEMDYAPRKIALPEKREKMAEIVIQKHHLDTNHHVNNSQYVQIAEDYLPEGFQIRQMRAEYKKQARLHDVFYPEINCEEEKVTVVLNNAEGQPYAVVEFLKR